MRYGLVHTPAYVFKMISFIAKFVLLFCFVNPYCINEENNLEIRNCISVSVKKKKENSIFSIYNPRGVKLFTCLRLQFSHLNEHKFRHVFEDTIKAICPF